MHPMLARYVRHTQHSEKDTLMINTSRTSLYRYVAVAFVAIAMTVSAVPVYAQRHGHGGYHSRSCRYGHHDLICHLFTRLGSCPHSVPCCRIQGRGCERMASYVRKVYPQIAQKVARYRGLAALRFVVSSDAKRLYGHRRRFASVGLTGVSTAGPR